MGGVTGTDKTQNTRAGMGKAGSHGGGVSSTFTKDCFSNRKSVDVIASVKHSRCMLVVQKTLLRKTPRRTLALLFGTLWLLGCGESTSSEPTFGKGVFEAPNPWTKEVGEMEKSADSDKIINWLSQNGGFGTGELRIDFSIEVLAANDKTEKRDFEATEDFYETDCDKVPFPVPEGGALEGEEGYACTQDGDCHLLVVHETEKKLYEMWRANIDGGTFYGGCAAVWDLTKQYPDNLRGEGCTSADAGGFPIAAMLFSADEIKQGSIDHAIRFILPNDRIRENTYVHPGTHSTSATSGGPDAPPYGVRLRLRKDFPLETLPSDGARVIAKGLQKYGMLLADGGNIALTGASDRFTETKWEDVDVDSFSLTAILPEDMEVADMGEPIEWSGDCIRN